jgi:hypothetical protein
MRRPVLSALTLAGVYSLVFLATWRLPSGGGLLFAAQAAVTLAVWAPVFRWAARDVDAVPQPIVRAGIDPAVGGDPAAFVMVASPVLAEIAAERLAQDLRWGEQNHPDGTGADSHAVAYAVAARYDCQLAAARGEVTWRLVMREEVAEAFAETDPARLRTELIQIGAVAAAWAEAIDRRPPEV